MKNKISIITLGVSSVEKSLSFYRDGLGFQPHNFKEGDDHPMLIMEGTWLALYPKEKLAEGANVPIGTDSYPSITLAHNVDSKEEVDEVFKLATSVGAKLLVEPKEVFWGGYSGYFADPDGHVWSVAYNPFTDLT